MTLGYDISDVSHTVYWSTSSMSKRSLTLPRFLSSVHKRLFREIKRQHLHNNREMLLRTNRKRNLQSTIAKNQSNIVLFLSQKCDISFSNANDA